MADNLIITPNLYAKLVLMHLGGALKTCTNMSHAVSKEFGRPQNNGHKPGDRISVKRPYRFIPTKGLKYTPQPIIDTELVVTVSQVAQVSYDWDSIEKTLSLREVDELYAKPAAKDLASLINAEAATFCADNAMNSAGTPGTAPTDDQTYLTAGDLIVAQGLPENEDLTAIVNRRMSSAFVHGTKSLFNPTGIIGKQWTDGEIQPSLGYKIVLDQTINTHTVGTFAGTPLVNLGNQTADGGNNATMTLNTDGWTTTTLNRGDKFVIGSATSATVGGVNSVHPRTRKDTGYQQQFTVVNTITDTAGALALVVYPAITVSGTYQNVTGAAVDNAIITMIGATGVSAQQGLLMHKTAFAFVSVPIAGPDKGMGAVVANDTDEETGISIQLVKAYDFIESREINKMLVLYDFASMYRELACVIQA